MNEPLSRTPLYDRHLRAGARMLPFAGYEMPIVYTSILEEHRHVRSAAGLFDVSHMGEIFLRGRDASALAQRLFTHAVDTLPTGGVRYGLLCNESGRILDDATLYRLGPDELMLCVNAATAAADLAWIERVAREHGGACEVDDASARTALLAIQGPLACEIAHRALDAGAPRPGRWRFAETRIAGERALLSRTGYTGEDGYEIYIPSSVAAAVWDALVAAGRDALRPVGLGARDTLRLEMGYPLYGQDIGPDRGPVEADLMRFVRLGRGWIGDPAVRDVAERGATERRVGLLLEGRAIARTGARILDEGGARQLGVVTSGSFGPSVERSIAVGYVSAERAQAGTAVAVDIRGRAIAARVCTLPFYTPKPAGAS
jgi:aminomethyltransferase